MSERAREREREGERESPEMERAVPFSASETATPLIYTRPPDRDLLMAEVIIPVRCLRQRERGFFLEEGNRLIRVTTSGARCLRGVLQAWTNERVHVCGARTARCPDQCCAGTGANGVCQDFESV